MRYKQGMTEPLSDASKRFFQDLTSGDYSDEIALISTTYNGDPSEAICVIIDANDGTGDKLLIPLFVKYHPSMDLKDDNNNSPVLPNMKGVH